MTTEAVRSLIREILAEELGRLRKERASSPGNEEVVSITSTEELQAFVQHILKLSRTTSMREKIARGDYVFRLGAQEKNAVPAATQNTCDTVRIEDGFLSERRVENLPAQTRVIQLGQRVRFTPLARDRLRQRKIAVERIK